MSFTAKFGHHFPGGRKTICSRKLLHMYGHSLVKKLPFTSMNTSKCKKDTHTHDLGVWDKRGLKAEIAAMMRHDTGTRHHWLSVLQNPLLFEHESWKDLKGNVALFKVMFIFPVGEPPWEYVSWFLEQTANPQRPRQNRCKELLRTSVWSFPQSTSTSCEPREVLVLQFKNWAECHSTSQWFSVMGDINLLSWNLQVWLQLSKQCWLTCSIYVFDSVCFLYNEKEARTISRLDDHAGIANCVLFLSTPNSRPSRPMTPPGLWSRWCLPVHSSLRPGATRRLWATGQTGAS